MTPKTAMIVTKETGAKTMPIGNTVAAPECEMRGLDLMTFAEGAELNGLLLANLMSAFAAHERCGVHLYRAAAGMTQFPEWREKYIEFGEQTENHILALTELISQLGGDPMYVSPQARMTEFVNAKIMEPILLDGSVDRLTMELSMLEAVILAERKCHANWQLLKALATQVSDSPVRQALQEACKQVEAQEDEHVQWAESNWQEMLLAQLVTVSDTQR
jgi:rubrerythrin